MASKPKKAQPKAKKAVKPTSRKPAPKAAKPARPSKPAAAKVPTKAAKAPSKPIAKAQPPKAAAKAAPPKAAAKAAPAKPAAPKAAPVDRSALKQLEADRRALEKDADRMRRELEKIREAQAKETKKLQDLQAEEAARREAMKKAEADRKAAEKEAERLKKEAERKAEQDRRAAEREAEKQRKVDDKLAAKVAAEAAKRRIPTTSLAATPVIRPLSSDDSVQLAPPPPPAKPGHADHQILSSMSYGLFAAINKTFGFAGQSVVKNAALRMLEYGYKRAWLPPKSKEPVRALNEFFGRLETMGYAEKIHVSKRGEGYVLEVQGLADFDAVHELRTMHYPLLPIFLGEMLVAIVSQYFRLRVTTEPIEFQEARRGFNLPFSIHEAAVQPEVSRLAAISRMDDFEE